MNSNKEEIFKRFEIGVESAKKNPGMGNLGARISQTVDKELQRLKQGVKMESAKEKISNLINNTRSTPVRKIGDVPLRHLITNIEYKKMRESAALQQRQVHTGVQTGNSNKKTANMQTSMVQGQAVSTQVQTVQNLPPTGALRSVRSQPFIQPVGSHIVNPSQNIQNQHHYYPPPQRRTKVSVNSVHHQRNYSSGIATDNNRSAVYNLNGSQVRPAVGPDYQRVGSIPKQRQINSQRAIPGQRKNSVTRNPARPQIPKPAVNPGLRSSYHKRNYSSSGNLHNFGVNKQPLRITGDNHQYGSHVPSTQALYSQRNYVGKQTLTGSRAVFPPKSSNSSRMLTSSNYINYSGYGERRQQHSNRKSREQSRGRRMSNIYPSDTIGDFSRVVSKSGFDADFRPHRSRGQDEERDLFKSRSRSKQAKRKHESPKFNDRFEMERKERENDANLFNFEKTLERDFEKKDMRTAHDREDEKENNFERRCKEFDIEEAIDRIISRTFA